MGNIAIFKGKLVKFLAKAGILVPARPDADRSLTPTAGETAFNTTVNKLEVYDGTGWTQLGAGGGSGNGSGNGLVHPTTGSTYENSIANPSMTGTNNTGIGVDALNSITSGTNNTAIGTYAGDSLNSGVNNVLIGSDAGKFLTNGYTNVAIGVQSLSGSNSGHTNVAIGTSSLSYITSGNNNVAIGFGAGDRYSGTSQYNTAINSRGAFSNTTLSGTVVIGKDMSGNEALASANNQFILGTSDHNYYFNGIIRGGLKIGNTNNRTAYITLSCYPGSSPVSWTLPVSNGTNGQVLTTDGYGSLRWSTVGASTTSTAGSIDASTASSFIQNGTGSRTITVTNLVDGQTINVNVQGANGNVISWTTTELTQKTGITYSNTMTSVNSVYTLIRIGSNVFINSLHGFG